MSSFRHADDPETIARSFAVTFGPAGPSPRHLDAPDSEDWHQLIYAVRGVVRVTTESNAWIVPPHRAVWLPSGVKSSLKMYGEVALRTLYVRIRPRGLLTDCAVVNITPLLRELIVRVNRLGALDSRKPEQARLGAVIIDELRALEAIPLQLPLPSDPRAIQFAALAGEKIEVSPPLHEFATKSGASRRTLERIFREETSLSLGQWLRRQLVLHALAMLGTSASVDSIANQLGYSSASAFIAMFRKELGKTPARYLSETAKIG